MILADVKIFLKHGILFRQICTLTANLLSPIRLTCSLKQPAGLSRPPKAAGVAAVAFMLPVATPPNTIVFGSGYVPMSKMIKGGIILNILGVIIITLIVYFFVLPVWGASIENPIWAR